MKTGPKYLFCGSRLTQDTLLMRAILEGLNTEARQWGEVITILDNGTVLGLQGEVEDYRHLHYRKIKSWVAANIVIAFMDGLHQNREIERTLQRADKEGIPTFVVSRYNA